MNKRVGFKVICLLAFSLLTAPCAKGTELSPSSLQKPIVDVPKNQEECTARGGRWGRFGLREIDQCDMPSSDAGKCCTDSSECQSSCVTKDNVQSGKRAVGKCFERTLTLGTCLNYVEKGKAKGVICED